MIAEGIAAALVALATPGASAPPAAPPAASRAAAIQVVSFEDAVRRAVLFATVSAVAAQEVQRAEGLLVQVRSGSLPFLSANGSYTALNAARKSGTTVLQADQTVNGNIFLSVPLLAASRWYQWSHAADQVDVAKLSLAAVQRAAALVAGHAYLSILASKRAVEVSQHAVEVGRAHFDFARSRREAGAGNLLDELRAEQQLASSAAQLELALTLLERSQEALGVATGSDAPLDATAEPDLGGTPENPADGLRGTETRADVRAVRGFSRAAERVARDSWADWLPTIIAAAQPFYNDPATLTAPRTGWQAQAIVTLPLFEGLLRLGQRQERDALSDEARTELEGLLLEARSEVRVSYATLEHADAANVQTRRAADRAQKALALVAQAYRAGATTSLDVSDAEQRARDADTAAVVAEDAVRQARLDLLAATGRFP